MRLQSKTGPRIPSGDDRLRSLRGQTEALLSQWRDRLGRDPTDFARSEVEIPDPFRRLGRPDDRQPPGPAKDGPRPGSAWNKGGAHPSSGARRAPAPRTLRLRPLGGVVVGIATTSWAPEAGTAQRRGRAGTGPYPELAALGIRTGATPALPSRVGRRTALLPAIALARDALRSQGPALDEQAVHRMARQLGAEVLTPRTRDLQR